MHKYHQGGGAFRLGVLLCILLVLLCSMPVLAADDYRFAGWNTKPDGTGANYDDRTSLDAIGQDESIDSLTLYAQWECAVTLNANGGTIMAPNGCTTAEKALAGKTFGILWANVKQVLATSLKGTKSGYIFVAWNTKPDGSGTNLEDYGMPVSGPVTFYATYYQGDYGYTGGPQIFTAPADGIYQLEVWGSVGWGDYKSENPQAGGYGKGEIRLSAGEVLYVVVGGYGINGGNTKYTAYNGGGTNSLEGWGAGGGGATHIARNSGIQLWQYGSAANASRSVLLVAGGSGGLSDYAKSGGSGGGLVGGAGCGGAKGGTQNSGYAFGMGEPARGQASAGGGGWYGGYRSEGIPYGGGGGSGWASPSLSAVSLRNNTQGPVWGGYARITLIRVLPKII